MAEFNLERMRRHLLTLPKYATIGSMRRMLTARVLADHDDEELAVDVLGGPIDNFTTAPHFVVGYLADRPDERLTTKEVYTAATRAGYRWEDIRTVIREWLPENVANVGVWWDAKHRVEYICWYLPREGDEKTQLLLDQDDW